ncbi:MAG: Xaa-Pro peptidase family protein [Rhodobacterales bacterium]
MTDPRLNLIRSVIRNNGYDAVAFVPGPNFKSIFGRNFYLMERPLMVIIPKDGTPVAIVPNLEMSSFSGLDFPGRIFYWRDEDSYRGAFKAAAAALPQLDSAKRFGLEAGRMRVFEQMALGSVFSKTTFIDAHAEISSVRLTKTPEQIALLKKAIEISEAALEATLAEVKIGQTEKEIEGILLRQMFALGADGTSFAPIVAAGGNAAEPHAHARADYKIKHGDALLIDFGGQWMGYNADITRTFFVGGVSEADRAFYDTVLAANTRGREVSRAGITAHDVDDAVQLVLEGSPFAQFARHKTGHGLGLDVHEAPQIMRGNRDVLRAGMIFTIEPGLYRDDVCGVRIEDDVVVTNDGIECLTTFDRALRIVG